MVRAVLISIILSLIPFTAVICAVDDCRELKKFVGDSVSGQFGNSLDVLGDLNGDGFVDLLVGANNYDAVGSSSGRAYVISGLDGESLFVFDGEYTGDEFGYCVASAGDVNKDGYTDFLIGAPFNDDFADQAGKAYVFSGNNGELLYSFNGKSIGSYFGLSVCSAGDLNDDGHSDIIIGAPSIGSPPGEVYVFSGIDGDTLFMFTGDYNYERLGSSVAKVGDIDDDGIQDFIIGAASKITHSGSPGKAFVISGNTGDTIYVFNGENVDDEFGYCVANAGDVNNDGVNDLIVSAHGYPSGQIRGRVYVFSGLDGDTLYVVDSPELVTPYFGTRVASAGDVNDDGFSDFMVSAAHNAPTGMLAGKVFVHSGKDGNKLAEFTGPALFSLLGVATSPAGDVNGDGFDDILVGAFWDGETDYYAGIVYLLSIPGCFGNRGDVNHDGTDGNIMDLNYLVNYIFRSGDAPDCSEEADINADGVGTNILDLTFLVNFIFRNGPAPGACY